jgi:hypothetical protein
MPLCSAGSAHEYLGWNLTATVTSVQNGDNPPSTAPGIEYLGTVGQRGAAVAADERGHIVHVRGVAEPRARRPRWLKGVAREPSAGVQTTRNYNLLEFTVQGGELTAPIPTALFATGLGVVGLLGWRRKRRAQAAV